MVSEGWEVQETQKLRAKRCRVLGGGCRMMKINSGGEGSNRNKTKTSEYIHLKNMNCMVYVKLQ